METKAQQKWAKHYHPKPKKKQLKITLRLKNSCPLCVAMGISRNEKTKRKMQHFHSEERESNGKFIDTKMEKKN